MEYPSLGTPPAGSIRFNTDSSKMEIYNGEKWWEIDGTSPYEQTGGTRGILMGGESHPAGINTISYVQINTTGNTTDFGDLPTAKYGAGASSRTYAFCLGGYVAPSTVNTIDRVTITSTGNATDYADCSFPRDASVAWSDSTRALIAGGNHPSTPDPQNRTNNIDYFTMSTNATTVDFGDLWDQTRYCGAVGSQTRMIIYGGQTDNPATYTNSMNYVNISTSGDTADFGDLTAGYWGSWGQSSVSSATRGCVGGVGGAPGGLTNTINYVTTASLGDAKDFGDLTTSEGYGFRSTQLCSGVRGIFIGGYLPSSPNKSNAMDYITIASIGNAVDYGDIDYTTGGFIATGSNGHGGLT